MSTAHATITFHRIDPERESTLLAVLRVHGFRFEYVDTVAAPLRLFRTYGVRDTSTLICDTLGTLIRRLDRTAVFTIGQDPNEEFVGQLLVSDPDLGDFSCAADEEGTPLLPITALQRSVDIARSAVSAGVPAAAAFTELDRVTGGPWWRHVDALLAARTNSTTGTAGAPSEAGRDTAA